MPAQNLHNRLPSGDWRRVCIDGGELSLYESDTIVRAAQALYRLNHLWKRRWWADFASRGAGRGSQSVIYPLTCGGFRRLWTTGYQPRARLDPGARFDGRESDCTLADSTRRTRGRCWRRSIPAVALDWWATPMQTPPFDPSGLHARARPSTDERASPTLQTPLSIRKHRLAG